jgi:hypothetical protein
MGRIKRWLHRVPLWVWLVLVALQVTVVAVRASEISNLNPMIEGFKQRPETANILHDFERIRSEKIWNIAASCVVASVALGLAGWQWLSRGPMSSSAPPAP